MSGLLILPEDVMVLILVHLEAWDVVSCQCVSRRWREAFLQTSYLREVLKRYPNARESCELFAQGARRTALDWRGPFIRVARRYRNLRCGRMQSLDRYRLLPTEQHDRWYPVGQWDYHESQPGGRLYYEHAASHLSRLGNKPYLFKATLWSYDDGVLVGPFLDEGRAAQGQESVHVLSALDVATKLSVPVPFIITGKVIRSIRFRNRTLVIEWAERDSFHALNDSEKVHRHFGTCFDITRSDEGRLQVHFRNEWKLHFLGLPLNSRDRFFSTHNGQHYAIYFWQPNRSMYTGDEDMPIESLFLWDISIPSTYLPSLDPSGRGRPPENERPHPLSVFTFRDLDFLGVRQHSDVSLMGMHIDSEGCSLSVRENVCVAGQGYFDPAERLMRATTTTFPFRGLGAANVQQWHGNLPPYRGHCSMETADIEEPEKWFLPIMDVCDVEADVRFSLVETCFTGRSAENRLVVRVKSMGQSTVLTDDLVGEVAAMGRIAGDERWLIGQNSKHELVILTF